MKNNNGSNLALDDIERINRYWYAYRNENYTYRQEAIIWHVAESTERRFCFPQKTID